MLESGEKGLHEGIPFLTTCLCEASLVVSAGRAMRLSLSSPLLSLHARVHLHLNTTMIMPMVHNMITSTIDTIKILSEGG